MIRILVIGKSGQVATALRQGAESRKAEVLAAGRPEYDLMDPDRGLAMLAAKRPDVIISAAAYTAVDKAESEADIAYKVNAGGPAALARLAAELDIPLIHFSTDYVFDGSKQGAYVETDLPRPLGVYGRTKLAGEAAVSAHTDNHVILRTSWVYSPFGSNFLKTMLRVAKTQPELHVVDDQHGNPTSAFDIAGAAIEIAKNLVARPGDVSLRGVFHLAGTGETTWADFAEAILAGSASLGGPSARVKRIRTVDYPTAAARPANSRLDTAKLRAVHAISMPAWQTSMGEVLGALLGSNAGMQAEGLRGLS